MRRSKHFKGGKFNTIIHCVPHQNAWIVERMGRFHRILEPGVHFLIPCVDEIRYRHCLKEMCIEIPQQEAITKDNVQLDLDAVLYVRVTDPYKASYGVQNPEYAISQLAQTVMRAEVGKLMLDNVFHERANLNMTVVEGIKEPAAPWGLICLRYEIRTMTMPVEIQRAMKMQVEAERKKRAVILESEGFCEAAKNKAEGEKSARILASEAQMQEQVNKSMGLAKAAEAEKIQKILQSEAEMQSKVNKSIALAKAAESEKLSQIVLAEADKESQIIRSEGLAKAILIEYEARATSLERMGKGILNIGGSNAAAFLTADNFVKAFGQLAKESNTLIIPSNPTDISNLVTQALSIYQKISADDCSPNSYQFFNTELVTKYFSFLIQSQSIKKL
ncbi:PHB domain-containing protein [Meloidogyne graminicola]|uniref:PHB domain-containing protein n=1 Tax=Meloidogyne graminicola TaxID=189291 RepID=A0A8S9ZRV5_9BILA|nr:PHB domain-containing protein [Meloidogyne graminicola]